MFHDRARIFVEGGRGGDGVVSFRREAHVPRGGPDGGDGGHGGDVVLVCDPSRRDLAAMRVSAHFRAERGAHGQGANKHGARGSDLIVPVPPGTTVEGLGGEWFDLVEPGQRATVAEGGLGGHGNKRFTASTRQAPRFAERGLPGRSGWIELRLRLLADAGLVGLPNAGKSSLLARITRAAPKVADYPFTTLSPVLGTIDDGERQLVLADIPGLIEGAADGAGLGHEFLAHVERCRVLVHLLELGPGSDPDRAYEVVRGELAAHGSGLERLPEIVALSKCDLLPTEELELELEAWRDGHPGSDPIAISSATGAGTEELVRAIFRAVGAAAPDAPEPGATAGAPEFEAEHRVYRPQGTGGFEVARIGEGVFEVTGRGVEMLVERHDLANPEALSYLERRLHEIGVVKALRDAGFESGDEVRVGDEAFDLDT
ncbi:MAG: GTPase ObgE [Solirubrobacterales bacterium]|nr:GTPase ObgE [Solirubrobacterales bacterium]